LGKFAPIHGVDHAVHAHQKLSLRIVGVHSLRNCDDPDAGERQTLKQIEGVSKASGEPRGVVNQDAIEGDGRAGNCREQSLQAGAVRARTGNRLVLIHVFVENEPSVLLGVFTALPNLIRNAGEALAIARESGVDGAAERHRIPSAESRSFDWNCRTALLGSAT
jgi:hypothetical protein